ncbi:multidrug efflux RND transporter permease AcrD [Serratia marcescens]|uniref:multidrug efflux RND transporter permease AcrD n=1 Tax=Serratia marcescens TaxID=615 RepID=UPI000F7ED581|nr:multidrug efflux RND transporter permease AcrD [Serratia marcescens]RTF99940.1 multidrug efflux RND transporter permease AcrD [Serratia marcescens]
MAKFFIDRPIFAWVIAIIVMLAGVLAIMKLPIAQYPTIAPPAVSISANYPGADAKTVQDTVTQIIEQNMNGIDNLMYMSSTSDSSGSVTITLTFESGTDPDIAQVQVQNKLSLATPLLPQEVQQQGLKVEKSSSSFLMVAGFVSDDPNMTQDDIADYVASNIKDPISRSSGVGEVQLFGAQYAMRIWLDPNKLNNYQLTTTDVTSAITEQNNQIAAGQLGGLPPVPGQQLNASIIAQTRLTSPEEFGKILLKVNTDGSQVRLRDVAHIERGAESYAVTARYNGKPAAGLGIKLATGANALNTAKGVKDELAKMAPFFPQGMKVVYPYDTTPFVKISINEVVKTLIEAIILVFLVMYLFLQNFRATLIPTIAVPVVLMGTFAILSACGFSINTLTMFAMVLAIGLLVDDAIVVVENVERVMSEEGLPPREATRKSMGQIQSALVGIALVLSAVFVPMAFFGGTTGAIYRQFSITIVSAMVLSVLVAMILTPALCATLLKPIAKGHHHGKRGFFGWFNRMFNRNADRYERGVGRILHASGRYMVIYLLLLGGMALLFIKLPTSFLPQEDRGIFTVQVQLPAGSTLQQTSKVVEKVERYFLTEEKQDVLSVFAIIGSGPGGNGQNVARLFVRLKDWDLRTSGANSSFDIIDRATLAFNKINEARVIASSPPAITGLGNSSGFDMELEDHAGLGHAKLMAARDQLLQLAAQNPLLSRVRHNGLDDSPQLQIDIDQRKAQALGVSIDDINNTLSTAWGSTYVNDFVDRGRVKKVYVQAAAPFRMLPDDINKWYVRNSAGGMVPFSAFASSHWEYGSPRLERYNGSSALEIVGEAANGVSTGTAMAEMEKLVSQLPTGFGLEWTAMSYQERLSGSQAPALYAISLLVVFLCLAALYESWSIPFSVMLVVPLGVIGAVAATWLRGLENDVYFQVGLLTIIGLSAKNAILIVEFANELNHKGQDLMSATLDASRMRLRPILMTSLAFTAGVLPLAVSSGAGANSRIAIGTGIIGGTLTATALAIFFVPLFYVLVRRMFTRRPANSPSQAGE